MEKGENSGKSEVRTKTKFLLDGGVIFSIKEFVRGGEVSGRFVEISQKRRDYKTGTETWQNVRLSPDAALSLFGGELQEDVYTYMMDFVKAGVRRLKAEA